MHLTQSKGHDARMGHFLSEARYAVAAASTGLYMEAWFAIGSPVWLAIAIGLVLPEIFRYGKGLYAWLRPPPPVRLGSKIELQGTGKVKGIDVINPPWYRKLWYRVVWR